MKKERKAGANQEGGEERNEGEEWKGGRKDERK
jgi:hypothetical protein